MSDLEKKLEDALRKKVIEVKRLSQKLDALERIQNEPIAIVGMSCRFPGKSNSPEMYWNLLSQGLDGISEVPKERWDIDAYYDPDPDAPGKMSTRKGGFIDDVDLFDAEFFNISPREARVMDPQQRLLLEITWEALERAGIAPATLKNTPSGVFIGALVNEYIDFVKSAGFDRYETYTALGSEMSALNGRISYALGLLGPSMTLDTACSSSLVSIHLACTSLRRGECNLAIAGGVNLTLSPGGYIMLSRAKMLAPDGHCKTFDARGDGYARGEGAGIVILKRLSDAERDGDNILAVIKATCVNQDGPSASLTVPNRVAQAELIKQALEQAKLKPTDISYVELHGTGTELGDPIEVGALQDTYGKDRDQQDVLLVGSAKSNIGHLEAAAGIAAVIKVVLALTHEKLPPNISFKELNPKIHLDQIPAEIVLSLTDWKTNQRAGVSSFGFTGTNAHMIIEKAPLRVEPESKDGVIPTFFLFLLSARTEEALDRLMKRYQDFLSSTKELIANICYTANTGRNHQKYRAAFIAQNNEDLLKKIQSKDGLFGKITQAVKGGEISASQSLEQLAKLYIEGTNLDWKKLSYGPKPQKIILPTYPFERNRYWIAAVTLPESKSKNSELAEWFYEWSWEKQPFQLNAQVQKDGEWIVFGNNMSLTTQLTEVVPQKVLLIDKEHLPDTKESFLELFKKYESHNIAGIIHLASIERQGNLSEENIRHTQQTSSESYLNCAQALVEYHDIKSIPLWFVTLDADSNPMLAPVKAVHKTFIQEHPDITAVHIDLDANSAAKQILDEIQAISQDEHFVRYQGSERYVGRLRHKPISIPENTDLSKKINGASSYLITGGLGGLGLTITQWLIEHGAKKIILTSRSNPAESVQQKIKEMEAKGATIVVMQADVSNHDSVSRLIAAIEKDNKPLKGIFHLAGVLDDKSFMKQTSESFEKVFAPKVYGSYYLHEETLKQNVVLDFLILFSSSAATIGSPGQANYAAANAFLDSFACYRNANGLAAQALAWGPWAEVGMAAHHASRHMKLGVHAIKPDLGVKVIGIALQTELVQLTIIKIDWTKFLKQMTVLPKWLSEFKGSMPAQTIPQVSLDSLEAGELKAVLEQSIIDITRNILELPENANIDPNLSFFEMGMDSLMAVEFRNQLQARTSGKVTISNNAIYEYPDISKLTEHVYRSYEKPQSQAKSIYPIDLYREADLGELIITSDTQATWPPKNIFITGVTGQFGSYVLQKCGLQFKEAQLYCLVRADSIDKGYAKIMEGLQSRRINSDLFHERIKVVLGDLNLPQLGIAKSEYDQLCKDIDLIFHCGAQTNWTYTYEMLKPANIKGTLELIKLAATDTLKPIHHISTIGVFPNYKDEFHDVIYEDLDLLHKSPLPTPYTQTKWVSEMQMHHAREKGLKINIYRPGQLVCDLENGVPACNEYSYRIVEGCRQLKYAPEREIKIQLTPVDVAAEIVTAIAAKDHQLNHNYNIVNPEKVSINEILKKLVEQGQPIEFIPVEKWLDMLKSLNLKESRNPIIPVLEVLLYAFEHEETDQRSTNTIEALSGEDINFPTSSETIIKVYTKGLL